MLIAAFVVAVGVFVELWRHPPHAPIIVQPVALAAGRDVSRSTWPFRWISSPAVMLLVVTGVGSLIHLFSVGYMQEDPGYARYFAYLNLFVVFMLVLVLGSSFPVMFIGWEGVGLCSYLLIGFWFSDKVNADAGKKAFIVNRIGDFGFLVAMFLIWQSLGTLDLHRHGRAGPRACSTAGGGIVTAITLFLFLGCTGKSAQIPLYTWLPDAMAGPTPVSALIHAATMVTAGVYLVARTNVLFALAPLSSTVVAGHRGAHRALRRDDRPAPVRHQEGAGLLHGVAAGLHVPRRRHRRLHRRRSSTWPPTPSSRRCCSSAPAA